MKLLLTSLVIFSSLFYSPAPNRDNVEGTWKVTGEVASTPVVPVCTMKQDDKNALSGTCKIQTVETKLTGKVEDKAVTFQFNIDYNGDNLTLTFHGTLDGDSKMKGSINVQPYGIDGDFTAEKDKPAN